jgi:FkbM family methyltransferase
MSTKYFILIKNTDSNQIMVLNNPNTHILPQVNLDYYTKHGLFEQSLIDWSVQFCQKDKVFLDIGAHSGTYTISLAKYCKTVHSFEPQRMTYYSLCGSVALSNIENVVCHNFGLGAEIQTGEQTLNIVSDDGGGSTVQPIANIKKTELITVKTLDSMNLHDIGFIKIDVEGNELNVLQGALHTLKQSAYPKILFESNIYDSELFSFLTSIGYSIVKITGYTNMYLATQ